MFHQSRYRVENRERDGGHLEQIDMNRRCLAARSVSAPDNVCNEEKIQEARFSQILQLSAY